MARRKQIQLNKKHANHTQRSLHIVFNILFMNVKSLCLCLELKYTFTSFKICIKKPYLSLVQQTRKKVPRCREAFLEIKENMFVCNLRTKITKTEYYCYFNVKHIQFCLLLIRTLLVIDLSTANIVLCFYDTEYVNNIICVN